MIDITRLSSHYITRILDESNVDKILEVCQQNTLFYEYTEARPTSEQIQDDMKLTHRESICRQNIFLAFSLTRILLLLWI